RYGAVGTLKYRTANCCDHAHLVVALARAAGLPARYVHGICTFSSGTYGHVWAELYVDGKWYSADATSSRNSLGVINSWNTATATILGTYASLPF
ncbi:MAG: transglutaminase family protein, partial [Methanobacteriales archaeon]|nr:transglutaminase family protein [Methanobacteriales archaeon]